MENKRYQVKKKYLQTKEEYYRVQNGYYINLVSAILDQKWRFSKDSFILNKDERVTIIGNDVIKICSEDPSSTKASLATISNIPLEKFVIVNHSSLNQKNYHHPNHYNRYGKKNRSRW